MRRVVTVGLRGEAGVCGGGEHLSTSSAALRVGGSWVAPSAVLLSLTSLLLGAVPSIVSDDSTGLLCERTSVLQQPHSRVNRLTFCGDKLIHSRDLGPSDTTAARLAVRPPR